MRCVQATGQLAGSRLTLDRAVRNLREVSSHRSSVCCVGRALRRRRCSA
jgi:N-acetylglucosamine-6-phosphate deacetylase